MCIRIGLTHQHGRPNSRPIITEHTFPDFIEFMCRNPCRTKITAPSACNNILNSVIDIIE